MPFKSQVYPTTHGVPYVFFETSTPKLSTVLVEHPVSTLFLDEERELSHYTRAFDQLSTAALPALEPRLERESYGEPTSLRLVQHLLYIL
jgi:hypothetical protein